MDNFKCYETKQLDKSPFTSKRDEFTWIEIVGLDYVYFKYQYKGPNKLQRCEGAVALIDSYDEDANRCGYLQLFYSYRCKQDPDDDIVRYEFYPAYDKDGNKILVRTKYAVPFILLFVRDGIYWDENDKAVHTTEPKCYLSYKTNGWNS